MPMPRQQRGAALLVSLMMLVILTLLGISAVNMSTMNFKITGNRQASMEASITTQNAIETVISDIDNFYTPTTTLTPVDDATEILTIEPRRCYFRRTASGYSLAWGLAPEDTNWDVKATYTDKVTSATATIHQGVQIRMTNGNCP